MSENTKEIPMSSEEFEALLPDGWTEDDDIFDVDSWTGGQDQADESEADDDQEEVTEDYEDDEDSDHATAEDEDDEESEGYEDDAPANEQESESSKLRFSAQIDHKVEDVELDEADLPEIYQKAHVTDRVRAKLDKVQPLIDKGNRLAKILGYDSMDAMLDAAADSYRQGEVERLTGEGVHPDVAEELVESRSRRAIENMPVESDDEGYEQDEETGTRDYVSEVADLLRVHPELRGTQLPEEVVNDCVVEGRPLASAYEAYMRRQAEAENKAIRAENKRLKQNADAARRAPVRGVSKGGSPKPEPDDPFLIGFNAERW